MFEGLLKRHFDLHCRDLSMDEVGAQLALASAAEARPDGSRTLTLDGEALALLLGTETEKEAEELLARLKRKGRVRSAETSPGVYNVRVLLFDDRWARERAKKRAAREGRPA